MKTKSYNVYSFAELSPAARERAISNHREFVARDFDDSPTVDDAREVLAHAGLAVDKVYWSGFSCQGDGASFDGSWDALSVSEKAMRDNAPMDKELHRIADGFTALAFRFPGARFTVKHSGHYSHEYCTDFSVDLWGDNDREYTPDDDTARDALIDLARDAMRWIYKQLEAAYDWEMEEEQIVESIEANSYEFTEDGDID